MKKIAVFIGEMKTEHHFKLVDEMSNQLKDLGMQLCVFQNFGIYGSNTRFAYGEKLIVNIPNLTKYDGIVICPDTFSLSGYEEMLLSAFKTIPNTPVISVRKAIDGVHNVYNLLIDDYAAMYEIVEHFVKDHHLKKIAFMKGRRDLIDAHIRYKAYEDVMNKYNLPITEHMTFEGNYWTTMGKPACDWFLEDKPEAIVCANDYMGISVVAELQNRGYKIPEDIAVSGYDNVIESMTITPSLTTSTISYPILVENMIKIFTNIWANKYQDKNTYIKSNVVYRNSCGCQTTAESDIKQILYTTSVEYLNVLNQSAFLYLNLDNAKSFSDFIYTLPVHLFTIGYYNNVYLCLSKNMEFTDDMPDNMYLRGIINARFAEVCNVKFKRENILPRKYVSDYMTVIQLHFKDKYFGYLVVEGKFNQAMAAFIQLFSQGIINWIDKHKLLTTIDDLYKSNDHLNNMVKESRLDALTKIANRESIDDHINKMYKNLLMSHDKKDEFFICSIDLDDLKYINDTFGHLVGDVALKACADILAEGTKDVGMAARFGGDEYMICFNTPDEDVVKQHIDKIRQMIIDYNANSGNSFTLSMSIGYARCTQDLLLSACIEQADILMYNEKRQKKNRHLRQ